MWPCYVLLLELLVPRDLFISYDLYLLVLPYSFHLVPLLEIFKVSFFLLFHRHFTWCHPWGSSSFSSLWFFHWNFTWHHPWRSFRLSCMYLHHFSWCLLFLLPCGLFMCYLCAPVVCLLFRLKLLSIIPVCWLLLWSFRNDVE